MFKKKTSIVCLCIIVILYGIFVSPRLSKNLRIFNKDSDTLKIKICSGVRDRKYLIEVFSSFTLKKKLLKKVKKEIKPYKAKISEQEHKDVKFVVISGAQKSSIALAMSKGEIMEALDRVSIVHPLDLLQVVAKDEELLDNIRKMKARDWVWDLFISKIEEEFSLASKTGVFLKEDIDMFSNALGMDASTIRALIENQKWSELINIIVEEV